VTDRESVEGGLLVREPYVLISIRDPGKRQVRVPKRPLCRAILELAFHDAEPVAGFTPTDPITYMTEKHAHRIWRFVREHQAGCQAIVVQCEQGMSRSPAVAAALAAGLGLDDTRFWRDYQPNRYIYGLVISAGRDAASRTSGKGHPDEQLGSDV